MTRIVIMFAGFVVAAAAEIRVAGSDLLGAEFARAVAEFARQEDTAVKLGLRGTRPGLADLEAGCAEIGLFLLPAEEAPPSGNVVSRVIGYQVTVVAVPVASPLTQVTVAQLRGIFGETAKESYSRWGELNLPGEWAARPIALQALAPSAGLAWPLFRRQILGEAAPRAALQLAATDGALMERLTAADNSIGVGGVGLAGHPALRALAVAASPTEPAYAPTADNVHHGNYPLRLALHVVFPRAAAPGLLRFLKFLLADETAAALAPAHFVPLPRGARNQLVFELEEMR
ncbi:MAG: substrate-binding domain-containing protein [Opitutae bacterium]|nr:substrate-binding domain-containing protein [Opitutae bacterium]